MIKLKRRFMQIKIIIKYIVCLIFSIFNSKKYENTWLISERGYDARDNGYIFYKYLKEKHPEIQVKYVIAKNSFDKDKINLEDIVYYQSIKHIMYFINSKYLISTHFMGYSPDLGTFTTLDNKNLVHTKGKRIFIQHGIIYNFLPALKNLKLNMFVTSADKERDFVINKIGYDKSVVKCTGLARYDTLNTKPKNFILVFPTWRSYLSYVNDKNFKNTDYFKYWNNFLKSKNLLKILKKNNLQLYFYPHPEIQRFCDCFNISNSNIKIAKASEFDIQKLLRECKIYITDYSSSSFDIAYMQKPIIYYQFDYNDFYQKHYGEGYLNFLKNGFGKGVINLDDLIMELDRICNNNFEIDQIYKKRINNFFKYHDQKNCDRIYNEIINLEKK